MTEFQQKVYKIVKKIPKGKVLTYRQVAERLGGVGLARAVGNALNKNPSQPPFSKGRRSSLRVPCHRVIRSDGRVGGYNRGVGKKTELLRKEGLVIQNAKVKIQ